MATAYIYNGFGHYETNDQGQEGLTVKYAGVEFWLPYKQTTIIPNYTFREVDHDKSTPQGDGVGELVYMNIRIPGEKIAEQMTLSQVPYSNHFRGIQVVKGKRTGQTLTVCEGKDALTGEKMFVELPEVEATKPEVEVALKDATEYRKRVVADFFQSKRERMTGGPGRLHPDPMTRLFMEEIGVEDNDDITAHAKSGVNKDIVEAIIGATRESSDEKLLQAVQLLRADIRSERTTARTTRLEKEAE